MSNYRFHAAWALLGAGSVASLWWAWSIFGAIGLFSCIGLAFLMWYRMSHQGAWVAVAILGLGMAGVLGWQAATSARCPAAGTKVYLKADKPPVGCAEMRASATSMATLFGIIGVLALLVPIYAKRAGSDEPDDSVEDAV